MIKKLLAYLGFFFLRLAGLLSEIKGRESDLLASITLLKSERDSLMKALAEMAPLQVDIANLRNAILFPVSLTPFRDELMELCRIEESDQTVRTSSNLGAGYFKGRRVMSIMKKHHPELSVSDLWIGVHICAALVKAEGVNVQA